MKQAKPESVEDVKAYMKEIQCPNWSEEAEIFFDYFESNGWKVGGRAPMKDWKAACRNWKRNARNFASVSRYRHTPERTYGSNGDHLIKCEYCGAGIKESAKFEHLDKCPKFKPASPETVKRVMDELRELSKKIGGNNG